MQHLDGSGTPVLYIGRTVLKRLILLLSEGQAGEASEASNKAVIFQISGSSGEKGR